MDKRLQETLPIGEWRGIALVMPDSSRHGGAVIVVVDSPATGGSNLVGMASIHQRFRVDRDAESVWDSLRDFGAVDERVAAGFVMVTEIDGDVRTVRFGNGAVAREILVDADDDRRRIAYSVIESPLGLTHHQATVEVVSAGGEGGCEFVWTTDVLPHEAAPTIEAMMAEGVDAIERTLSR